MMPQWLAARSPRERFILALAGVLLVIVLVYGLVWRPVAHHVTGLEKAVRKERVLLQWLEQTAIEIERLRSRHISRGRSKHQSLLALVDQTARQAGLGNSIRRVEPNGKDGVRLRFEAVAFDALMGWLEKIVGDAAGSIRIEALAIDRRDEPGLVDARMTLRERLSQ